MIQTANVLIVRDHLNVNVRLAMLEMDLLAQVLFFLTLVNFHLISILYFLNLHHVTVTFYFSHIFIYSCFA